jgi:hypothetical protein
MEKDGFSLPSVIIAEGNKELKFYYILILLGSSYFFSRIFKPSPNAVFGILLGLYIIYELYNYKKYDVNDKNKKIIEKLEYLNYIIKESYKRQDTLLGLRSSLKSYIPGFKSSVQLESYLFLDPNMINLLYSIKDFETYSSINYSKILVLTNNILKLLNDMRLKDPKGGIALIDCAKNFEVAQHFTKLSNNYFHSFVYSLPPQKEYSKKYMSALKRFRLLNKRNLDTMKDICTTQRKINPVSIRTVFIGPEYEGAKPHDLAEDTTNFFWFN